MDYTEESANLCPTHCSCIYIWKGLWLHKQDKMENLNDGKSNNERRGGWHLRRRKGAGIFCARGMSVLDAFIFCTVTSAFFHIFSLRDVFYVKENSGCAWRDSEGALLQKNGKTQGHCSMLFLWCCQSAPFCVQACESAWQRESVCVFHSVKAASAPIMEHASYAF